MILEQLVVGPIQANCYILGDETTREAVVIDPGGDTPVILRALQARDLKPVAIVATHGHFDHVEGLAGMKRATGAPVCVHPDELPLLKGLPGQGLLFGMRVEAAPEPDVLLEEGQTIPFGSFALSVLHTPGHSPGSVSLVVDKKVFVGDLLFAGSIGRTDLQGGDYDTLIRSVREKIFTLPDDTVVYPGHGPATTVATEKRTNPFFVY
ncbi:MBL fold metallo-hydrolase [Deferrisoma camini]|uniref:MBL fold metallo-hydrolase n=1 Tax=Deferrisoma camini TaxID=1035120 RepID=UPI00046D4B3C|nr:MBL fold metallo-hydrolase [Deferrisoma camini]